jgi:hypothetical protein
MTWTQKKKKARKGMDSEAFIDHILEPLSKLVNRRKTLTLYLDNATPHVSQMTATWCRNKNLIVVNLAPRSPDINVTENVWSALEAAVAKMGIPKDLAQLEQWILQAATTLNFKHLYDTIRFDRAPPKSQLSMVSCLVGSGTKWKINDEALISNL